MLDCSGGADDLAAQLPQEIQPYLKQAQANDSCGLDEFYRRVSQAEGVDLPVAVYHARAVVSVVFNAVSEGEIEDVRAQLPDEYDPLFKFEVEN
jgi:uncharacterized protein (DUF2267 family)